MFGIPTNFLSLQATHRLRTAGLALCLALCSGTTLTAQLIDAEPPTDNRTMTARALTPPTVVENSTADGETPRRSSTGSILTTCGALGLVILLVMGVARAWKPKTVQSGGVLTDEVLELLGGKRIGPRQSIQMIRVGNRILVLGQSEHGLTTLSEITDAEEVAHLAETCRQTSLQTSGYPFRAVYDQFVNQLKGAPSTASKTSHPPVRLSELQESNRD